MRVVFSLEVACGCSVQELDHEDVLLRFVKVVLHVLQELGDANVIVLQELNDVHALPVLGLALRHVGVVLEELGHTDVAVGHLVVQHVVGVRVHVIFEELNDCHVHVALRNVRAPGVGVVRWGAAQVLCDGDAILG